MTVRITTEEACGREEREDGGAASSDDAAGGNADGATLAEAEEVRGAAAGFDCGPHALQILLFLGYFGFRGKVQR